MLAPAYQYCTCLPGDDCAYQTYHACACNSEELAGGEGIVGMAFGDVGSKRLHFLTHQSLDELLSGHY